MRILRLILLLAIATAFRSSEAITDDLNGTWKEYYGIHGESDVNYNDLHVIDASGNDINIKCIDRSYYGFEDVSFRKGVLTLRMRNPANGSFFVDYALTLSADGSELVGRAVNVNGSKATVKWVKMAEEQKPQASVSN